MELKFVEAIVLVGDGPIHKDLLATYVDYPLIAVDGGANALTELGLEFDYICGDMDSVDPTILSKIDQSKTISLPDQNFCDFEKTLSIIIAPKIHAFGFLGGRMSHSLEALRIIAQRPEIHIELIGLHERAFVVESGKKYPLTVGHKISLIAIDDCRVLASEGLKYSLEKLVISPKYISLSNEVLGEVMVRYEGSPLVAILEVG